MARIAYRNLAVGLVVAAVLGLISLAVAQFRDNDQCERSNQAAFQVGSPQTKFVKKPASAMPTLSSVGESRRFTSQPAQIKPYEQTEIFAKASGFVSRVHVDIGDTVEEAQVLAELWIPEMDEEKLLREAAVYEAAAAVEQMNAAIVASKAIVDAASSKLDEVQATIARYQAEVEFRRGEHDRFVRLVAEKTLNESLLDEKRNLLRAAASTLAMATAAVASAEANVQVEKARQQQAEANRLHAQARLKVAAAELKKTEVLMAYALLRAPFDGVITERRIDTGAFVASAVSNKPEPLFTLCRTDRLRIVVDVPESEAALVHEGQAANLKVDAINGTLFPVVVKRTAGVLDTRTHTLRVEAELTSAAPELRPGMFGNLTITLTDSSSR